MKRKFRLRKSSEFQRVRRYGKSTAHPLIVMVVLPNELDISRLGVVAGRRLGKAVQRNRAKRLMRAAFHPFLPSIPPGWDLILIARQPLLEAPFSDIQTAISQLLRYTRLLEETR